METEPHGFNQDLVAARGTITQRIKRLLEVPGVAETGSLASAEPPASVAAAFGAGLVGGLERCGRFFGRRFLTDLDPNQRAMCRLALSALLAPPSGLQHALAFGPPEQVAPLLATMAKLVHASMEHLGKGQTESGATSACDLLSLAKEMSLALAKLWADPRIAAGGCGEGPATARPQLWRLLTILLRRWLPAVVRVLVAAEACPECVSSAQGCAGWAAVVLASCADPRQLEPLRAADAAACTAAGAVSRPEAAAAAMYGGGVATAATDDWRRWIRSAGSPVQLLGMLLRRLRLVEWTDGDVRSLQDCILAAAMVDPETLRSEVALVALSHLPQEPSEHARGIFADIALTALQQLCACTDAAVASAAASQLAARSSGRALARWPALLLTPGEGEGEEGAGLPLACGNPRCTNLAGTSDADLAAEGGGRKRCGGRGSVWFCSAACQGAVQWSAGWCGGGAGAGAGRRGGA
ncbi:hypothetical protein GPECTOR_1g187 [Gonium pectorale]|uniref:phytol kinase n=1 Tax=Gonium pectorale TaxID=33097 RepID=A0A150H2F9_GONPE|nr:hypothetical protein GPECTOR_1g187 [Gonium pectorale]|eukprot:KXZ56215.1 hypothetical protein GPECTOR_1g187 [Gonium pectorale]